MRSTAGFFVIICEIMEESSLEKLANEAQCQKMTTAFRLTQNLYNNESLCKHTKLRHYGKINKPQGLYEAHTLVLHRQIGIALIRKGDR